MTKDETFEYTNILRGIVEGRRKPENNEYFSQFVYDLKMIGLLLDLMSNGIAAKEVGPEQAYNGITAARTAVGNLEKELSAFVNELKEFDSHLIAIGLGIREKPNDE